MNAKKTPLTITVAQYLETQLAACGKQQAEIAREVGFEKANVITMMKQGKTKLPLAKVGKIARALGVDGVNLFRLVMNEYYPETWEEIEGIFQHRVLTENELAVVNAMRVANVGSARLTGEEVRDIVDFISRRIPKD